MAKKKSERRPNLSADVLERARAELSGQDKEKKTDKGEVMVAGGATVRVASRSVMGSASRRIPTQEELRQDYAYVLKDLRNLAVLAGALFVLIIIIAVVLPR